MDPEIVEHLNKTIYRKYPEFARIKPKVRKVPVPRDQAHRTPVRYYLTYSYRASILGGKGLERTLRVMATPQGKIIKTTTSR